MTKDVRRSLWADRAPDGALPALSLKDLNMLFETTWKILGSTLQNHVILNSNWNQS